jgi:hypothetical protein
MQSMSDLVAIAYEDLPTTQQVASNLGEAVKGHDVETVGRERRFDRAGN